MMLSPSADFAFRRKKKLIELLQEVNSILCSSFKKHMEGNNLTNFFPMKHLTMISISSCQIYHQIMTHTHASTYIRTRTHIQTRRHVRTRTHTYTHAHTSVHAHTYAYTHVVARTDTDTQTHTRANTRTHTVT